MTDFATRNRRLKALDMVAAIDDQFRKQLPNLCAIDQSGRILLASHGWTDAHWLQIAKAAGYKSDKTPGPETRRMVREILSGRATAPLQRRRAS